MANSQKLQSTLQKELNELKNLADEQMHAYQSQRALLYKGLAMVYLWWAKANKEKGLLEKLYKQNNIQYKKEIQAKINFSVIRPILLSGIWRALLNSMSLMVTQYLQYQVITQPINWRPS